MLIDRVLTDLDLPDPEERRGNPIRGSRLGRCARQSAYMLYPDLYPPAPLPARAKLVFRFGDMIHDLIRAEFRRVLKGEFGMEEEPFHFAVSLSHAEAKATLKKLQAGQLRGRLLREGPTLPPGAGGLILDESQPCLYVPVRPDGIADLSDAGFGLATVEIKSMATGSFRRALEGEIDYAYRVQMAVEVDAAGLDTHVYVSVRKDTCHALEVIYTKRAATIEVRFTKSSRLVEIIRLLGGNPDEAADWEGAEVQHPFESALLDQARARVKRILLAEPNQLPMREYGPSFVCETCEGTGTQTKAKNTGELLKKGPKPCGDCTAGQREEADLPFQCSYCPYVAGACWKGLFRLELTDRPRYIVTRDAYLASGLGFVPPERETILEKEEKESP